MKNQRYIWIIALIVIVLIFCGGLWIFYSQYNKNKEVEKPIDKAFSEIRSYCELYGAKVGNFPDSCTNDCKYERDYDGVCFMTPTLGCSCGEGNCWNTENKKCEPIGENFINTNKNLTRSESDIIHLAESASVGLNGFIDNYKSADNETIESSARFDIEGNYWNVSFWLKGTVDLWYEVHISPNGTIIYEGQGKGG